MFALQQSKHPRLLLRQTTAAIVRQVEARSLQRREYMSFSAVAAACSVNLQRATSRRPLSRPQQCFYHSNPYQAQRQILRAATLYNSQRLHNQAWFFTTRERILSTPWNLATIHNGSKKFFTTSSSSEKKTTPTNPQDEPIDASSSASSSLSSASENATETAAKMSAQVRNRVNRMVGNRNWDDWLVVSSIVIAFTALAVWPWAERQMSQSNRQFDDIGTTDDPVDDFPQLAREEWLERGKSNPNVLEDVLKDVVRSQALQQASQQFVVQILQSDQVHQALNRLVKELWSDLVTDPETVAQVIHLMQIAIRDPDVKQAAQRLLVDLVQDEEVKKSLIEMVQQLGVDQQVQAATQALLVTSAHRSLNDAEILEHSMEFATDVLGDDVVQQTAGEALRNTVGHAFRPAVTILITATGITLILFGIVAIAYARSSEQEVYLMDMAAKSLQTNAAFGLERIFSWPFRRLYSLGESIGSVFYTPMKGLVHFLVELPRRASRGLVTGVVYLLTNMQQGFVLGVKCLFRSALSGLTYSLRSLQQASVQGVQFTIRSMISWLAQSTTWLQQRGLEGLKYVMQSLIHHLQEGQQATAAALMSLFQRIISSLQRQWWRTRSRTQIATNQAGRAFLDFLVRIEEYLVAWWAEMMKRGGTMFL